jgi:hypothetical protein
MNQRMNSSGRAVKKWKNMTQRSSTHLSLSLHLYLSVVVVVVTICFFVFVSFIF